MLKRFRKWISVLTAFCLAAGLFCGIAPSAYAYKGSDFTSGTLATRLDTIISKGITSDVSPALPAVGGTFPRYQQYTLTLSWGTYTAKQCVAYVFAAYNYLFDCDPWGSGNVNFTKLVAKNNLTYDDLNGAGVKFGAYLRTTPYSSGEYCGTDGHSVLILAYDSSKIITLDAVRVTSTTYKTRINEYTWDNFNNKLLKGDGRYVSQLCQPSNYDLTGASTVQNYTVTFNANGGSVSKSSVTVQSGGTISLPTPTRDGYTFGGWYTSSSDGTQVTSSTKITSNMTLYAHWLYTVTFDAKGGSVSPTTKQFTVGDALSGMPTPTRNGYVFKGWTTEKDYEDKYSVLLYGNGSALDRPATLYAVWAKETTTCTITLNANGGTVSKSSISTKSGNTASLPTPTRTGYTFDGWYTSKNAGTKVTSSSKITSDMVLYAHWTAKSYTITFDAKGGSVSKSSMTVSYGETYSALPTPTKSGYTFGGWYYDDATTNACVKVTSSSTINLTSDTTFYATWTKNGSTSNTDTSTSTSGTTHKLTFDANGGTLYIEGDSITIGFLKINTSSINNKNLETFTLVGVKNGGTYGYLPSAKKTDRVFDGWYTSKTGGTKITTSSTISLSGDQTLYAHWLKWGSWSSWSTTKVSETSTREVETKEVKVSSAHTEYRYYRYLNSTGEHDCWCETYFKSLGKYSGIHLDVSDWTTTPYTTSGRDWTCGYCKGSHTGVAYTDAQNRPRWTEYKSPNGQSYYWYETRTVSASYQTQYRYRNLVAE